jgi:hypothetical protein
MWFINRILTAVFDTVYAVLGLLPNWASLTVLSGLVGVAALFVVRYCSNQKAMGKVKDDIKANMLALKLFKDELPVVFRSQGVLLWSAVRIQLLMLPPLVVMIVPFVLVAAQMGLRYQWRPLNPGEESVLTVGLRADAPPEAYNLTVDAPEGVVIDRRVRKRAKQEVDWTVRADKPGVYTLTLVAGDEREPKRLTVGADQDRVSPKRPGRGLLDKLLYPAERPFSADSRIQSISIAYPTRDSWFCGADWWILWFLVLSIVIALIFKPLIGVKF